MKKVIAVAGIIISSLVIIQCNDSANGKNQKDTTATDTTEHKIVTEGGLKDSLATGATDTTKH